MTYGTNLTYDILPRRAYAPNGPSGLLLAALGARPEPEVGPADAAAEAAATEVLQVVLLGRAAASGAAAAGGGSGAANGGAGGGGGSAAPVALKAAAAQALAFACLLGRPPAALLRPLPTQPAQDMVAASGAGAGGAMEVEAPAGGAGGAALGRTGLDAAAAAVAALLKDKEPKVECWLDTAPSVSVGFVRRAEGVYGSNAGAAACGGRGTSVRPSRGVTPQRPLASRPSPLHATASEQHTATPLGS